MESDTDWEMIFNNNMLCRDPNDKEPLEDHKVFKRKQLKEYRGMCEKGLCQWYGIFIEDKIVADMAVFIIDGVAFFQDVETIPEYRRKGICGSAVYDVSRDLLESKRVHTLTMAADEDYHAARIYESLGYKMGEKSVVLINPSFFD